MELLINWMESLSKKQRFNSETAKVENKKSVELERAKARAEGLRPKVELAVSTKGSSQCCPGLKETKALKQKKAC